MRPLVVLSIVLAAVAALVFALFSLDGGGGSTAVEKTARGAGPATPKAADLEPTETIDYTAASLEDEPDRIAIDRPEGTRTSASGSEESFLQNGIGGVVSDPDGNPIEGVELTLKRRTGPANMAPLLEIMRTDDEPGRRRATSTDAMGHFEFVSLEPGADYVVQAVHDDWARTEVGQITVLEEGTTPCNIRMDAGYMLHGYVFDHTGQPVAGARLELLPNILANIPSGLSPRDEYMAQKQRTDDNGYYRFSNVEPGQRSLSCRAKGFGSKTVPNLQFGGPKERSVNQDFRLQPAMSISGRVVGPDHAGIEGAVVEALFYGPGSSTRSRTASLGNGVFSIDDLSEGSYMLIASAEGYENQHENRIDAGSTDVLIELNQQGSLQGRVVDALSGQPLSSFTCDLRKVSGSPGVYGRPLKTMTFNGAVDGQFQLGGVGEGQYVVQARAPGYAASFSEPVDVTQGLVTPEVLVRMTHGGALKGLVVDRKTGEPVRGALVQTFDNNYVKNPLTDMLGVMMSRTTSEAKVKTNEKGEFLLEALTPEVYQLQIEHPAYTTQTLFDLRVENDRTTEVPAVLVTSGGIVRGTVYGKDGEPLAGAAVTIRGSLGDGPPRNYTAMTGGDGRYLIRRIAGGAYQINAHGGAGGDVFGQIIDMKNSEVAINVVEGQEYTQDLYLGGS